MLLALTSSGQRPAVASSGHVTHAPAAVRDAAAAADGREGSGDVIAVLGERGGVLLLTASGGHGGGLHRQLWRLPSCTLLGGAVAGRSLILLHPRGLPLAGYIIICRRVRWHACGQLGRRRRHRGSRGRGGRRRGRSHRRLLLQRMDALVHCAWRRRGASSGRGARADRHATRRRSSRGGVLLLTASGGHGGGLHRQLWRLPSCTLLGGAVAGRSLILLHPRGLPLAGYIIICRRVRWHACGQLGRRRRHRGSRGRGGRRRGRSHRRLLLQRMDALVHCAWRRRGASSGRGARADRHATRRRSYGACRGAAAVRPCSSLCGRSHHKRGRRGVRRTHRTRARGGPHRRGWCAPVRERPRGSGRGGGWRRGQRARCRGCGLRPRRGDEGARPAEWWRRRGWQRRQRGRQTQHVPRGAL